MNKRVIARLAAAVYLVVALPLLAHHGGASFDNEKTLTLKGTVTEWLWANPHCFLKIDVKDESGYDAQLESRNGKPDRHHS